MTAPEYWGVFPGDDVDVVPCDADGWPLPPHTPGLECSCGAERDPICPQVINHHRVQVH